MSGARLRNTSIGSDTLQRRKRLLRLFGVFFAAILCYVPHARADWQVWTTGNTIWVKVGAGLSGSQCCRGAGIDDPDVASVQCSQSCPASSEVTQGFTCNSVGTHVVYAQWSDDHTNGYVHDSKTIEVTQPAPVTCPLFDFYGAGSQVLTHEYGVADTYPSGQTSDAQMTMKLRPRRAPAGTTIYLRVYDPPDTAPYGPPQPRPPGDNVDTSATAGTISGSEMMSVTLPAAGVVTVNLRTTETTAGDNYVVHASPDSGLHTDPNFVCDAMTNCRKSPTITAWKRVYVETDRMFRRGAYIANDVGPCPSAPCFIPLSSFRGIGRGDTLRLIHAPRRNFVGPQLFYGEDVRVVRIARNQDRVEVTPFQNAYFGPDQDDNGIVRPFLADAAGVISGNDVEDFFDVNPQLISPLFDGTFVEHLFLQDDPVPFLPFEEQLLGGGLPGDEVREIARKWFFNFGRSNHQHLLSAREHFNRDLRGLTTARIGTNWCWIFVERLIDSAPHRGGREWAFNGEVTAHEIAHQWQVNPPTATTNGHCSRFRWNSAALYCTMHGDYGVAGAPCSGTCPEFYDGQVGFHYQSAADSEFIAIRQRPEPVPQF